MPEVGETIESETAETAGKTNSRFLPTAMPRGFDADKPQTNPPRSGIHPLVAKQPHELTLYQKEKLNGTRRSTGVRKLNRLSHRHLQILARHLDGESGETIAKVMNITVTTVSRILNDPLSKELLTRIYSDRQNEIDALAGSAIAVVRDGLTGDHSLREKLTAVDKFTKLRDSIGNEEGNVETAEDVIARMFKNLTITDSNIQFNLGEVNGRRSRR